MTTSAKDSVFEETVIIKQDIHFKKSNAFLLKGSQEKNLLPDRFELISELGKGGMGVVYKAKNRFTNAIVAIKMIYGENGTNDAQRLMREAQAASSFKLPQAASILDFGIHDEMPYLVMEYLEGTTLEKFLRQEHNLDDSTMMSIVMDICLVLEAAHAAGVIHRDIKPSNIMLEKSEHGIVSAKLLDFGLAKIVGLSRSQQLTQAGDVLGTPLYMSPEQCKGETVDQRSDIYALGALMYHCLTGFPAHKGETVYATIYKRLNEPPPAFSTFAKGSELEELVMKCLELKPENRYQNVHELLEDLRKIEKGERAVIKKTSSKMNSLDRYNQFKLLAGAVLKGITAHVATRSLKQESSVDKLDLDQTLCSTGRAMRRRDTLIRRAVVRLADELQMKGWAPEKIAASFAVDLATIEAIMHGKQMRLEFENLTQLLVWVGADAAFTSEAPEQELEEILSYYSRAIDYDKNNSYAFEQRAQAYVDLRLFEYAVEDLTVAFRLRPQVQILKDRATVFKHVGNFELALKDCNEVLRREQNATNYQKRGGVWHELKQYENAIEDFNQAIKKLAKPAGGPYASRAKAYEALGARREAIADLQKCLEIDPLFLERESSVFNNCGSFFSDLEQLKRTMLEASASKV